MSKESDLDERKARLRRAGLRATRQRTALAGLLFGSGAHRHVTAEQLYREATAAGIKVVLATVYNTLHRLTDAGLLREVAIEPGRSCFDTNVAEHHHFYFRDSGRLQDIPAESVSVAELPTPPAGTSVDRIEVIIRLRGRS